MKKSICVVLGKNQDIKEWNAVSNFYADINPFTSRSGILRILIKQEYKRLFPNGTEEN